jgi:pimeloyl-ACP methyl ester carboxylesterase
MWLYEEERLLGDYEIVTPDLPGFGRSDAVAGPLDLGAQAAAVREVLEELDLRDALVVGFAFGAAVAMQAAADSAPTPDGSRLAGLVLVAVPSAAVFPAEKMIRSMRRDWPDFARRSAAVLCGRQSPATRDWVEAMYRSAPLPSAIAAATILGGFEPVPLAGKLAVPARYVHGADDDVIPSAVSAACAEANRAAEFELIEDCGHLVVLDQPDTLHAAIRRALEDTAQRYRP